MVLELAADGCINVYDVPSNEVEYVSERNGKNEPGSFDATLQSIIICFLCFVLMLLVPRT